MAKREASHCSYTRTIISKSASLGHLSAMLGYDSGEFSWDVLLEFPSTVALTDDTVDVELMVLFLSETGMTGEKPFKRAIVEA
jgi:hypothetical protein